MEDRAFPSIASERLRIRRFEPRDAAALAAYRSDPEVNRYQAFSSCTLEQARRFIDSMRDLSPGRPGAWFQLAVALSDSDALIGDFGLRCRRSDPRQAELGFTFARAHQGRGYASEAVRRVLDYAFPTLDLHRVFALTDTRNDRAQRLLERAGFRQEGRLVEAVWFKGAWASELLYAILRREWGDRPGAGARTA